MKKQSKKKLKKIINNARKRRKEDVKGRCLLQSQHTEGSTAGFHNPSTGKGGNGSTGIRRCHKQSLC